jgi:undecaprenyl diphosphate synthase
VKNEERAGVPRHIAVIMDGNGRWAAARALPRPAGHRMGVRAVKQIVENCARRGVQVLTLFAFSSENWKRPKEEVSMLMSRFLQALDDEVAELHENGIRLTFVGNLQQLAPALRERMDAAAALTAGNSKMTLVIAIAYGGRWDIACAARQLAERCVAGELRVADIDEAQLGGHLTLAGLPDPDLLIRTGGEQRISNFLLWNLAYTELYFCDALWPDFNERELDAAIEHFGRRQRRFGLVPDQAGTS